MERWVEALLLLLLAGAGIMLLSGPRGPRGSPARAAAIHDFGPSDFSPPGADAHTPEDPHFAHLRNSTAAHGTHTFIREDGVPSLEGKSSFVELTHSTDDRIARVHGALQRRQARTLSRPKTAQAMNMMTPWLEPYFTKNQQAPWWGNDEINV